MTEETKKKISQALINRKRPEFSEEWKENMRQGALNRKKPNNGWHHSEETKKKMSENRKGIGTHHVPHSEETKEKIRQAQLKRWEKIRTMNENKV